MKDRANTTTDITRIQYNRLGWKGNNSRRCQAAGKAIQPRSQLLLPAAATPQPAAPARWGKGRYARSRFHASALSPCRCRSFSEGKARRASKARQGTAFSSAFSGKPFSPYAGEAPPARQGAASCRRLRNVRHTRGAMREGVAAIQCARACARVRV